MGSKCLLTIAFAGLWAAPLATLSAQAPIELDIGAPWEHPHSGIVVPDELSGLSRESATEFAQDFLNNGFSFTSPDGAEQISLYIYRHTGGALPIWFRQAQTAVEIRDIYEGPELAFGVEQYGWPGADAWQGLRAVYATPDSRYSTATAVALFSVDGWLVKMRVSSTVKDPGELAQMVDAAFAQLTPPDTKAPQPPAVPVVDCEEKLRFKKARDAKPDAGAAVLGALLGGLVSRGGTDDEDSKTITPNPSKQWCRDGGLDQLQVAYRADAAEDAYFLAISDSGIGIWVQPDAAGQLLQTERRGSKSDFSITLETERERINYVLQDRLPSFRRVLEVVNAGRTVSSVSTWGDDTSINIGAGALED